MPRFAIARFQQVGGDDGRQAAGEDAGELVHEGDARVAHLGVEQVAEQGRFRAVHGRIQHAQRDDHGTPQQQRIVGVVEHDPEGGNR